MARVDATRDICAKANICILFGGIWNDLRLVWALGFEDTESDCDPLLLFMQQGDKLEIFEKDVFDLSL